jgi:hypothetical protein
LGSGIRDPRSGIRDPEKTYSGSRIPDPGVKKHPIPDPGFRIRIRNTESNYWFIKKNLNGLNEHCINIPEKMSFTLKKKSVLIFQQISIN